MGYKTAKGQYVDEETYNWSSQDQAADANGAAVELGERRSCRGKLVVTAVSASDSLDVKVQGSDDGSTWFDIVSFTQATGATTERKTFVGARFIRPVFDVTGASIDIDATFEVTAV